MISYQEKATGFIPTLKIIHGSVPKMNLPSKLRSACISQFHQRKNHTDKTMEKLSILVVSNSSHYVLHITAAKCSQDTGSILTQTANIFGWVIMGRGRIQQKTRSSFSEKKNQSAQPNSLCVRN